MVDYYNDYVFNDSHPGHKNPQYRVPPPMNQVLRKTDLVGNVSQIRNAFRYVEAALKAARKKQ